MHCHGDIYHNYSTMLLASDKQHTKLCNTNFVKVCVASKSLFPGKRASRTHRMSSVDVRPGNPLDNICKK